MPGPIAPGIQPSIAPGGAALAPEANVNIVGHTESRAVLWMKIGAKIGGSAIVELSAVRGGFYLYSDAAKWIVDKTIAPPNENDDAMTSIIKIGAKAAVPVIAGCAGAALSYYGTRQIGAFAGGALGLIGAGVFNVAEAANSTVEAIINAAAGG